LKKYCSKTTITETWTAKQQIPKKNQITLAVGDLSYREINQILTIGTD